MIFIIGTKFQVSGSERTRETHHCSRCGAQTPFIKKSGRNYITLFFVLPIIPIGKSQEMLECPNCKTRYQSRQLN
jgi:hypothetical protein